jgi:hypothetical protein
MLYREIPQLRAVEPLGEGSARGWRGTERWDFSSMASLVDTAILDVRPVQEQDV